MRFLSTLALRAALFAVLAVVAGFAGLVVHEVVGHALPAWLLGGRGITITLNPDFTGYVSYSLEALAPWRVAVVDAGGIAVNLASGMATIPLAELIGRRAPRRHALRLLIVLFGGISVYKALEYSTMTFFYGGPGDPLAHADVCTVWHSKGFWAVPLVLLPFAMFAFGRAFIRAQASAYPGVRSIATAVLVAAPTLLVGGAFYYRASLPVIGDSSRWVERRLEAKARTCHLDRNVVRPPPVSDAPGHHAPRSRRSPVRSLGPSTDRASFGHR